MITRQSALLRKSIVVSFLFCGAINMVFAANTVDLPKSLFISPSALWKIPDETIREWFEHIAAHHRTPGSPQRIDSLVLSDIADIDPDDPQQASARLLATPTPTMNAKWCHPINHKLDVIAPYFNNFDAVYVGSAHIKWTGAGNEYDKGIQDAAFRQKNLRIATNAMDRFIARYPHLKFKWYISYEANLNYFTDSKIKDAYVAYLSELCRQMKARCDTDILWSPNFWSKFSALSETNRATLVANLKDLFARVPVTELHYQDFMGGSSASGPYRFTPHDVKNYYDLLAGLGGPLVRVNVEMFVVTDLKKFSLAAMSHADYVQRMKDYNELQLPLGASWEIRYWYPAHQGATPCGRTKP